MGFFRRRQVSPTGLLRDSDVIPLDRRRGNVTIELSRDIQTGELRLTINKFEDNGVSGHGFLITGRSKVDSGELLLCHVVTATEADEIRAYLDHVEGRHGSHDH